MRYLALIACVSMTTAVAADPLPILESRGWCPRPSRTVNAITRNFEVSGDLVSVRPLRTGLSSERTSYERGARMMDAGTPLWPTIADGKLKLSTYPMSCRDTNMGCSYRLWSIPAKLVREDPVPRGSCIAYAVAVPAGMLIGVGTVLRAYAGADAAKALSVTVPALEQIDVIDGTPLFQDGKGWLYTASWTDPAKPPVMTRLVEVGGRALSISRGGIGLDYVFTQNALVALDTKTFAKRWQIAGEIWAVMTQDVPLLHVVLAVERDPKPRVVLRTYDVDGKLLRSFVVYNGPVAEATLGESNGVFIVHIATS
jgi:hypothetical protein